MAKESMDKTHAGADLKDQIRMRLSQEATNTSKSKQLNFGQESILLKHLPKLEILDLGQTKEPKSAEQKLDSKKSVADLMKEQKIIDKQPKAAQTTTKAKEDKEQQTSIKCTVKVLSMSAAQKEMEKEETANFIVRRSGKIECLKNPESPPAESITVVVEPPETPSSAKKPTTASEDQENEELQRQKTEDLTSYLSERLAAKGRQSQVENIDKVEEVSARVKDVVEPTTADTTRKSGVAGSRSHVSSDRVQEQPASRGSSDSPKEITYDYFVNWLYQEMKATNAASLQDLMKRLGEQGKLPKEVVAKFADKEFLKEFEQFLQRWSETGITPSEAEMQKFLPPELRAVVLGDASSCAIADATNATPTDFALRIAEDAKEVALRMRTSGYCFRGVKRSLLENNVKLYGRSAYMAKEQLERDGRFEKILTTDNLTSHGLLPGDVIVHPKGYKPGRKKPDGHIAVYLGNGREASDHLTNLIGGKAYVFRPRV